MNFYIYLKRTLNKIIINKEKKEIYPDDKSLSIFMAILFTLVLIPPGLDAKCIYQAPSIHYAN